ncbi:PspC domain-containing protein [Stackebrandtia nassauensis]|uniref:Phage shock protein C, PspC n=1 Tax=Stackebrandtia nassauensis (strain DSM 44728 / CIP 108903 / NRRL B-16338 / NBRC 102104 / LLR-40K-21) TaxID=446470 RepID=D3Q1C7_STANL|nr:PspC domain-containing protein [Stackebrandtia nassauensis]ADD45707.1 phage shock protein C, PspC [Stackebrandtia nassauensis DSM 44728]
MTEETTAPPSTGGRAARFGLIRSAEDRRIAGVGAALGRATGTDPLLWRVLLAVLTLFAGAGLVLYLLCWLAFPAEGDQTSPFGAMVSTKRSSTSRVVTVLLGLGAVLVAIMTFISTNGRPFLVFAFIAALVVVLARRKGTEPVAVEPETPPAKTYADEYAAPFAPHGPYANRTLELPAESPPPPPPPAPPPAPRQRPERSSLGLVTFCLVVIVIGGAAILDMLGAKIPLGSTIAVALLICGGGLLLGTWWGRGRGLILLGVVLSISLAGVSILGQNLPTVPFSSQYTQVVEVDDIPSQLTANLGESGLDLSGVDFADDDRATLSVNIWTGTATILVPENLDVIVNADFQRSTVTVDGEQIDQDGVRWNRGYESLGPDGKGGGTLVVNAVVESGSLEIER